MKEIFELVEDNEERVVVRNLAKSSLDVALHPYVSSDFEYITVKKGHIAFDFFVTRTDGTSFHFHRAETNNEQLFELSCEVGKYLRSIGVKFQEL